MTSSLAPSSVDFRRAWRDSGRLAVRAVRTATPRQLLTAVVVAVVVGLFIGWVTVLIPNDVFGRDIAPVAWDYPVLIATAVLSGLLAATYVSDGPSSGGDQPGGDQAGSVEAAGGTGSRGGGFGVVGAVASWFAVGCPVCNKLALLAFGYAGAQTWFAPMQPVLAVTGLVLLWTAIAVRLQLREQCPIPVGGRR